MKKIAVICLSAAMLAVCGKTMAQKTKTFAGSIKFEIKYEGDFEPQQLANAPREVDKVVFGNYTKTTQMLGGGGAVRHQIDMTDSMLILIDAGTEKVAIGIPVKKKDESEESEKNYKIVKRADTKNICGFECQGYDINITVKDEDEEEEKTITYTMYTTTEIGIDSNINKNSIPGLQGYPLYTSQPAGENKTVISQAIEVKKKKINPIEFSIPSNYKYYTIEQWNEYVRSMQGGAADDDEDF